MTCCMYRRSTWLSVLLFAFAIQVALCSKGGTCDDCNSNCQPCCNQCGNNGLRYYPLCKGCPDNCCYGPNQRFVYRRDPCCRPSCSPCTTSCSPCATSCSTCVTPCSPCTTSCSTCNTVCSPCTTSCSPCTTTCSTGCSPCSSPCSTCSPCSTSCGSYYCDGWPNSYYNNFGCNVDYQCPLGYPPYYPGYNCDGKNTCCREFCKVVSENCLQRFLEEYNLAEGEYKICPCPQWMTPRYYCVRYIGKCCKNKKKGKKGKYKKGKKSKKYWKKGGKKNDC